MRRLAIRTGYPGQGGPVGAGRLQTGPAAEDPLNRQILDHLLHDAFGDDPEAAPETDLVLDPASIARSIQTVPAEAQFPRCARGI